MKLTHILLGVYNKLCERNLRTIMTPKIKVYDDILREEGRDIFSFLLFSFLFKKNI